MGLLSEARRGATAGLFFGAGVWAGMLLLGNYEALVKRIKNL